jgi:hypothetical protein
VVTRPAWCADTGWGEKAMFAHQAQHAPPRSPDPGGPQPGPDLAMPLTMERDGADVLQQRHIGPTGPERCGAEACCGTRR